MLRWWKYVSGHDHQPQVKEVLAINISHMCMERKICNWHWLFRIFWLLMWCYFSCLSVIGECGQASMSPLTILSWDRTQLGLDWILILTDYFWNTNAISSCKIWRPLKNSLDWALDYLWGEVGISFQYHIDIFTVNHLVYLSCLYIPKSFLSWCRWCIRLHNFSLWYC